MTKEVYTSPVGRMLSGSAFQGSSKGFGGKVNDIDPATEKPKLHYEVGVAFPKSDPATIAYILLIHKVAQETYPKLFRPDGTCLRSDFAFKYTDGDSDIPNLSGKVPNQQPNYPGNYIVWFKTWFAPTVVDEQMRPITKDSELPRGYYVRVGGTVNANPTVAADAKPGVHINQTGIQRCGTGEVIVSGPDLETMFGAPIGALPAGASPTPQAPTGGVPGGATPPVAPPATVAPPTAPAPPVAPPAAVAPPAPVAPPVAPAAPTAPQTFPAPTPAADPFAAAPAPPAPPEVAAAPPPPAPAPPPAGPAMVPGCQFTYEALKAQGWSDDQMRAAGHLA